MRFNNFFCNFGSVKLLIKGANLTYLVNEFIKNDIQILEAKKTDNTTLFVHIKQKYLQSLIAILNNKCYTYDITHKNGFASFVNLGVFLGVFLCVVLFFILSNFCLGVKINTENIELNTQINEVLKSHNLGFGNAWKNMEFTKIEDILRKEIENLSMVNVSKKGAFLWVNFSDAILKSDTIVKNSTGIMADKTGVVSRVFVSSGTALVKPGDTVSIGQMLIAPYFVDMQENQVPCEAKGAVYLDIWDSQTVEFCENTVELVRTGKVARGHKVVFLDNVLGTYQPKITFSEYETVMERKNISNILPVFMEFYTYYELQKVPVQKHFEDEKEALIYLAKQKILQDVLEEEILEEKHTISLVEDKYFITYYVKREVKI